MSNGMLAIGTIDYREGTKEDFNTVLARMCGSGEDYFMLCSSEAALKGDITTQLLSDAFEDKILLMPTVVHVLRGKRRLLQHPEFLFSIVGKVFDSNIVRELLDSCSFATEIDFMAKYYLQFSEIQTLEEVFYYEPSQDVIGRELRMNDAESFLGALRLFPDMVKKELLRKWTKTASSRMERGRMCKMITKTYRNQKDICEEFGTYYRIRKRLGR